MADYERVLKQRNSLLKSARARGLAVEKLTTLDIWDERLVALGSELIDQRLALVDELREPLAAAYRAIVDADHGPGMTPLLSIDGAYPDADAEPVVGAAVATAGTRERFADALRVLRPKELERGITLVGPHRDDVVLLLNDLPAKGYASHGESWSFALALRLASAELLRRDSMTGDPVLVLDDVFAELDRLRRERLAQAIAGFEQVLVTAAVLEDVPLPLTARIVHIAAGRIVDGEPAGEPAVAADPSSDPSSGPSSTTEAEAADV